MELTTEFEKLEIPPAVSFACGTKRIAGRFRDSYPDPGGLGRAIHMLAFGQEKTAELIRALGSEYENKYLWNLIATADQRRKLSPVLSYSAFAWDADAIIDDLKASIQKVSNQASTKNSGNGPKIKSDPPAGCVSKLGTKVKISNEVIAKETVDDHINTSQPTNFIFDSSSTNYRGNSSQRLAAACVDLLKGTPQEFVTLNDPDIPVSNPHGVTDTPAFLHSSQTPGLSDTVAPDGYNSPGRGTITTGASSIFSGRASYQSTPTLTPPNSADKIGPIVELATDHSGGAQVNVQESTVANTTCSVPCPFVRSGNHLGDGITQLDPFFSPCGLPPTTYDAAGVTHKLVAYSPDGFSYQGTPAQGADGKIYVLQPSGVAIPVRNIHFTYKSGVIQPPVPQLTRKVDPFPYPRSEYQPWKGIVCYDVPPPANPNQLAPFYATSQISKRKLLMHKLKYLSLEDEKRMKAGGSTAKVAKKPIHTFIDLSNIMIGFYDHMKTVRGIPVGTRVLAPEFSFDNFHALLTRDRQVEKKIVVGSLGLNAKRPSHMVEAQELGYEMNILQRVTKQVPRFRKKIRSNGVTASDGASGADTSGDDGYLSMSKFGEQGVDELLHLKILESVVDSNKGTGTIVLATGDGAQAEFSGGFKEQMERALEKGWHVELYSWSQNLSSVWKSSAFTEKWGKKFRSIALDDYAEELHRWWLEPQN